MSKLDDPSFAQTNSNTIYASLNNLLKNGIEIDKNLRQPTYYSRINLEEFKNEIFAIINHLLNNQKVPLWLSQRIAWYYCNKNLQNLIDFRDVDVFKRDKLVDFLRKSISKIIAEWFNEKSIDTSKSQLFSFSRYDNSSLTRPLKYSEFGLKNKRRIMEDKTSIYENSYLFSSNETNSLSKKRSSALFAVFDGHCGADCSQYVSIHLPMYIIQHEDFKDETKLDNLLIDSFSVINQRFSEKAHQESLKSGSTCCLALLNTTETNEERKRILHLAWCGDTQFCLVKNGKISYVTQEHKPNNPNERKRIEESGGQVTYASEAWRINGSLSVARSFGDINYQPCVTSRPDIEHLELDGTEDYFVIGCDGLWDTLKKNDLLDLVYENRNEIGVNVAELLVRKALENGSLDNITAIFVLLKDDLSQIEKPIY